MGNGIRPINTSFTTFMKSISKSFVLDSTCATLHLVELMAYQPNS